MSRLNSRSQAAILTRGISSLTILRYATKILSLGRLALVARFLGPTELGVYGLSLLVMAVSEVLTETGVNLVLLKDPKRLANYIHTAWAVSLVRGVLIAIFVLGSAQVLPAIYETPSLKSFLLLSALIPLIRGAINPAIILFQQRLQFEKEAFLRVFLQLIDLGAGLVLAWWWQSAMGLIAGIAVSVTVEVVISFLLFSERPVLTKVRWSQLRELYAESKFIVGNGVVYYFTEHLDDFLVGKLLGPAGLGLYQTAYKLASAVTMDVGSTVGQALYPVLAQEKAKGQALSPLVKKSSLALLAWFMGVGVFLLPSAHWIIEKSFGSEWLSLVPAFQVLFLAGSAKSFLTAWNPVSILADTLAYSLVLNVVMMILLLAGIWVLAPVWGVTGTAWAVGMAFTLVFPFGVGLLRYSLHKVEHA